MRTPLSRIRFGAMVLGLVFILAVTGFCLIGGYSIVDSIWMVVVTISSVGYSEKSTFTDPAMKLFTVGVIVVGMAATAYTLGGLVQLLVAGELQRTLGQRRMTREINDLRGHVVICGFGRVGRMLAQDLTEHDRHFVVVDHDPLVLKELAESGYLHVAGDAAEDTTLTRAGIEHAETIVSGLPDDAHNVFITLTARSLNPNIKIIARAQNPTTEAKLLQAGADRIVMPSVIGAERISRMITKPSTAQLISFVHQRSFPQLELDEISVPPDSALVGKSVRSTDASKQYRLLIIAIQGTDGEMVFNPPAEHVIEVNDTMLLTGHADAIERFRAAYDV